MILHYLLIKIVIHVGFCSEVLLPCNKELKQQKNPAVTVCSESYAVKSTNTSTKLNLSLRDTPQSVKVFTREDLEGRNIVSFQDLTNNITEVSSSRTDERQLGYRRY